MRSVQSQKERKKEREKKERKKEREEERKRGRKEERKKEREEGRKRGRKREREEGRKRERKEGRKMSCLRWFWAVHLARKEADLSSWRTDSRAVEIDSALRVFHSACHFSRWSS